MPARFQESDFSPPQHPLPFFGRPEPYKGPPTQHGPGRVPGSASNADYHRIYPTEINDEAQTFTTRTFMIRYSDEEVSSAQSMTDQSW